MQLQAADFFKDLELRRQRLLASMPPASIAILPSGRLMYRNADAEYPFRQNSNFYYLTGLCEPDSVMILTKDQAGRSEYILFCQPKRKEEEIWTGPRVGLEDARKIYGAQQSFEIDELDNQLPSFLSGPLTFFYSLGVDTVFDARVMEAVNVLRAKSRQGTLAPHSWVDLNRMIHQLRLKKSAYEIACLRQAAEISARAHLELMKRCRAGAKEYQLEGVFLQNCYWEGARNMAYTPIVASGENACILHYTRNDGELAEGQLLLVDAGCEYQYYAADITRTFPVSGTFSETQRALYQLVLKSQQAAIEQIRPGVAWNTPQEVIVNILVQGLVELGLLQGSVEDLIKERAYQRFYMHSSGHWLGLDVHDAGEYKAADQWRLFEPGHVLTVEPGLYIAANQPDIDAKWWGMGIRIEDDILVTEQGCEILSRSVPKTIEEIEAMMNVAAASR